MTTVDGNQNVSTIPRRRTELGLLLLAGIVTGGAYALVSLGRTAVLPVNLQPFLGVIAGLLAIAHIATRLLAKHADATLLPIAGILNGIGYVFIVRLQPNLANRQAAWTGIGIIAYVATLAIVRDVRLLDRSRYLTAVAGLILLLLPLVPGIGISINGARIWVRIGPVTFQPGELAKITLAIFFASYLVQNRELLAGVKRSLFGIAIPEIRYLGPISAMWGLSLVIMVAQRDLGSSLLFFTLFVTMLWLATGRGLYLLLGSLLFVGGAYTSWVLFSHVQNRVSSWLNPWPRASTGGFQIVQSVYAFGSGGVAGTGLALGSPTRIPYSYSDFIFAAIGEELGLVGSIAVLSAFLLMVGTGLRIAMRATRPFDKMLAAGLTTIIGAQTFIIVGGVTRLVPLTGVTLPFVSYGGSSLVINYVILAILIRISHTNHVRESRE
jgi:cell division protein FtsW (lipid II flippase)